MKALTIDALPPLPYVTHEILLAVNSDENNVETIAATLNQEPGLTARVISLANAAFFAHQRAVYSTEDAVLRLGLNRVRVVAASLLLSQQFDPSRCPAFRTEDYWHAAVGTAFALGRLSPSLDSEVSTDAASLAGLLHNIGLMLLVHVFPREMQDALRHYESDDGLASLARLCRQAVGVDHHRAGQMLLNEWNLPPAIAEVAGRMGEPQPKGDHATLVQATQYCAGWAEERFVGFPSLPRPAGVTDETLQRVAAHCRREEEQMAAFAKLLAS